MDPLTYQSYKGYYYELNGKFYIGQEFNFQAPQIVKMIPQNENPLRKNPLTSVYSYLTNITLPNSNIPSITLKQASEEETYRNKEIIYIAKQLNTSKIFFISGETYIKEKNNPLYAIIETNYNPEFGFAISEENRKTIPEIDIFIEEYGNKGFDN